MPTATISCVITLHGEGLLAHKTFLSVHRAIASAQSNGITCEIVLVLDRPTEETLEYVGRSALAESMRRIKTDFGDPGLARNAGVTGARGEYVAILDGDDLYSENWLEDAYKLARQDDKFIVHSDLNIYFGKGRYFTQHQDQREPAFRAWSLLIGNLWTVLSFARRDLYLKNPFAATPRDSGLGYEDWHWNCETIAKGFTHVVARGTAHFVRIKEVGSRNADALTRRLIPRHSSLFDNAALLGSPAVDVLARSDPSKITKENWNEALYLLSNPDVAQAVKTKAFKSGYDHWKRFGKEEGRFVATTEQEAVAAKWEEAAYLEANHDISEQVSSGKISSGLYHWLHTGWLERRRLRPIQTHTWLIEKMRKLAHFELELFPSPRLFAAMGELRHDVSEKVGEAYSHVLAQVEQQQFTHVFLVPWLTRGGADLVALHHINHVASSPKTKILVITTEDAPSAWLARLPNNAVALEFGRPYKSMLRKHEQQLLLMRLLLKLRPQVIYNANCELAWEVFVSYGLVLSAQSKLFASIFGFDYSDEGEPIGYAEHLAKSYPYLTRVFCDSRFFIERLKGMYGFKESLFTRLRYPHVISDRFAFDSSLPPRILWAGRFAKEKRLDVLRDIARKLPHLIFDVYGSTMFDMPSDIKKIYADLEALPNVNLKGEYPLAPTGQPANGFGGIPTANYAMLLYTTQWDGLPNIILEAMASGLPVLAPAIGGIPEVIPPESGFLVERFDDIDAFVLAIETLLNEPSVLEREKKRALSLIEQQHSESEFRKASDNQKDYF